ncbi:conjugative transfer system coupling protein TraD (plasmid) [Xanthomonas sontii]|uniref:conjugative transfer system coupling protein TraD n=1 Tax=Xanthomonas sontii TaxID=2650745 RepID=UPI003F84B4DB
MSVFKDVYEFEDPFRTIYEFYAIAGWLVTAFLTVLIQAVSPYPPGIFMLVTLGCLIVAGVRGSKAYQLWSVQKNLTGQKVTTMTREELKDICADHPDSLFLGYGFEWGQEMAQMTHMIGRADPSRLTQGGQDQDDGQSQMGQPWIHGIGMNRERPIRVPLDHTAGHTLLVGTTRAGKSRTLDSIIAQCVNRGEAVIIWDPKGDKGLKDSAKNACDFVDRPQDFIFFHPAFPEHSARIDPLKNFNRATELASRVAALIPSETGNDPFVAHAMGVLTSIIEGLLMVNTKPTLTKLKRYVDSGVDSLLRACCEKFFTEVHPSWREEVAPFLAKAAKHDKAVCGIYVGFYREVIQKQRTHSGLEGLMGTFEHDKAHQAKMLASLVPVLTMLTAGTLGPLLSPDPDDLDDDRPITDFARIIANRQVCYIGLDSLSDNMVGSAVGSMFVSDMTAVSGDRYNFFPDGRPERVNLIIDEAAELVSDKMIQLLNKAGGSNLNLIIATQTFADFEAKVGSAAKARQVLGNLNNVMVLRTIDGDTQEYIAKKLPETWVRHIEYAKGTDAGTAKVMEFGYRMSETVKEEQVPMVKPSLLGCLPNLEFFGIVSGGRLVKCRIPLLDNTAPATRKVA